MKLKQLYSCKEKSTTDLLLQYKTIADSMKTYSYAMLHAKQYLLKNNLTSIENLKKNN